MNWVKNRRRTANPDAGQELIEEKICNSSDLVVVVMVVMVKIIKFKTYGVREYLFWDEKSSDIPQTAQTLSICLHVFLYDNLSVSCGKKVQITSLIPPLMIRFMFGLLILRSFETHFIGFDTVSLKNEKYVTNLQTVNNSTFNTAISQSWHLEWRQTNFRLWLNQLVLIDLLESENQANSLSSFLVPQAIVHRYLSLPQPQTYLNSSFPW